MPESILSAAQNNDLEAVKRYVDVDLAPLNQTFEYDQIKQTIAHVVARNGNLNMLKYILEKDAELLQARDSTDATVLGIAIEQNSFKMVKYLVDERKADILQPYCDRSDHSYVHYAALLGHLKIFKYFVEAKNVDPNLADRNGQPLAFPAARTDSLSIIEYLVEHCEADLTAVDSMGRNILIFAAGGGALNVSKYLLDVRKLKLKVNSTQILHEAVKHSIVDPHEYFKFVEYFVEQKHIDVNVRDEFGKTALHWAAIRKNLPIFKYLSLHGADLYAEDQLKLTPLRELAYDYDALKYVEEEVMNKARNRRSPLRVPSLSVSRPGAVRNWIKPVGELSSKSRKIETFQYANPAYHIDNFLVLAGVIYRPRTSRVQSNVTDRRFDTLAIDATQNLMF